MKKIISLIAAIALLASMAIPAFADNTIGANGGTTDIGVNAKYNSTVAPADTISVNVEWGKMEFTYNLSGTQTWDPKDHTYTPNTTAQWSAEGNVVKLTNHSNVAISATFIYTKIDQNVNGAFAYDNSKALDANGAISLNAGEVNQPDAADFVNATLSLSGDLSSTSTTNVQVGTVTVKIAKQQN